jgi:hypothetical protein
MLVLLPVAVVLVQQPVVLLSVPAVAADSWERNARYYTGECL